MSTLIHLMRLKVCIVFARFEVYVILEIFADCVTVGLGRGSLLLSKQEMEWIMGSIKLEYNERLTNHFMVCNILQTLLVCLCRLN